jgi:hypothetical protein
MMVLFTGGLDKKKSGSEIFLGRNRDWKMGRRLGEKEDDDFQWEGKEKEKEEHSIV